MKLDPFQFAVTSLLLVGLSGCGGGGGNSVPAAPSSPVTSTLSFPLQSAYHSLVANGVYKTFTVSGTTPIYTSNNCSGTGSLAVSAANTAATFEAIAGFSSVETITMTNCSLRTSATTTTRYYDSNYNLTGSNSVVQYGVYLTPPALPSSVTVGSTGNVGTETEYTNSTKTISYNQQVVSYVIEADTANSAIVNFIVQNYANGSLLTFTEQHRYQIASTGALIPISTSVRLILE